MFYAQEMLQKWESYAIGWGQTNKKEHRNILIRFYGLCAHMCTVLIYFHVCQNWQEENALKKGLNRSYWILRSFMNHEGTKNHGAIAYESATKQKQQHSKYHIYVHTVYNTETTQVL